MRSLEDRLARSWKSRYTSVALLFIGTAVAMWANYVHALPGVAVAILGFIAAIMSVRSGMASVEKFVWIILITAILVAEIRNIVTDRRKSDATQTQIQQGENGRFDFIAQGVEDSILLSRSQFETTIAGVDGVLKTTQDLAKLSENNLEAVTGGDSFAFLYPSVIRGTGDALLKIHNDGAQALIGVQVTIERVLRGSFDPRLADDPPVTGNRSVIPIGTLSNHEGRMLPDPRFSPLLNAKDTTAYYHLFINAQNEGVAEDLRFRPSKDGKSLDYRILVWRVVRGKHMPKDFFVDGEWIRLLKQTDWIPPNSPRP